MSFAGDLYLSTIKLHKREAILINGVVTINDVLIKNVSSIIAIHSNKNNNINQSTQGNLYIDSVVENVSYTIRSNKLNDNNDILIFVFY